MRRVDRLETRVQQGRKRVTEKQLVDARCVLGPNGKPEFTKKLTSAWPHINKGAAGVKPVRVRGRALVARYEVRIVCIRHDIAHVNKASLSQRQCVHFLTGTKF